MTMVIKVEHTGLSLVSYGEGIHCPFTTRLMLTNFLLMTSREILTLEDNNPEGAAGQAWMPNTPVASLRAPSLTIRSAPAPPSSAG